MSITSLNETFESVLILPKFQMFGVKLVFESHRGFFKSLKSFFTVAFCITTKFMPKIIFATDTILSVFFYSYPLPEQYNLIKNI